MRRTRRDFLKAGAAATGAQILIGIVLVLFLLVIFGVIAIA